MANNNYFMTYEAVEKPVFKSDLYDDIDISDWASGYSPSGNIITNVSPAAKELISKMNMDYENDNNDYSYLYENPAETSKQSASSINKSIKGNKQTAMKFFMDKGLSAHAAAGIVGNLIHESAGLQTTITGDGGKAYGIAQWWPDRRKGLEALAKARGTDKSDFDTQLEYVWQELNSPVYRRALDGLLNAKNVSDATKVFMKYYEKPGIEHFEERLKHANSLLNNGK